MTSRQQRAYPVGQRPFLTFNVLQVGPGALHQQAAQVLVATLADAQQV